MAIFLGTVILAGSCLAETTGMGMDYDDTSIQQIEEQVVKIKSLNFTWLNGKFPQDDLARGNVGGGDILAFQAALESDGFTVQLGELRNQNIIELVDLGISPQCYGNNLGGPYLGYVLPRAPGQIEPNPYEDKMNMSVVYRLRPDEAIVYIGKTPPNCTYFSYQTFLYYHYYPMEGMFRKIFGAVGDTINPLTANTSGESLGYPFDKAIIIMSTADKEIDNRIRTAAMSSGYSPDIFNTEIIPSNILRMGVDAESDSFAFLQRNAYFQNQTLGMDYLDETPGIVLRVTPNQPVELNPYPMPKIRVRGNGNASELDLMPALSDLRAAILEKYGRENATEFVTGIRGIEGYDAIQRGISALGATRDTTYLNNTTPFTLDDDPSEFLIIYGVNHAATGKASYSNLGIFGAKLNNGVASVDNKIFEGTAEEYIPGNPAAKYLYVWKFARDCNGDENCTVVPTGPGSSGIGLNETAFVVFRAYLEKETKVGPSYTELAYGRVIKFGSG